MKMQDIRDIAREYGIKSSHMNKLKLVQAIQLSEGNFNCFASATDGECNQLNCIWREDCFAAAKKLHS